VTSPLVRLKTTVSDSILEDRRLSNDISSLRIRLERSLILGLQVVNSSDVSFMKGKTGTGEGDFERRFDQPCYLDAPS
jgi:hypothetical protein